MGDVRSSRIVVVGEHRSQSQIQALQELKRKLKKAPLVRRGQALMKKFLTPDQWKEWLLYRSVRIRGSRGGLYEVGPGWSGMCIALGEDGEPSRKICYHPDCGFIEEDRVLALVLDIQADESMILTHGNTHHMSDEEKRRIQKRRFHRSIA